jgi:MtrB/PioB family decaheme-associated outer membrane protein
MTLPDRLSPSVLALALIAAFGPAWSQTAPAVEGSASVGIGFVTGDREDRSQYDQYNGLRPDSNAFGIFGADYYRRDDTKGTVIEFQAVDLLNRNRELGLRWKKPGDWKFGAGYSETTRNETAFANTGLVGAGSTSPQVVVLTGGPGTGSDYDFRVKRSALGFDFSKVISSRVQIDASVKSEKKEGSRLWGIGMACPSPIAPGCRATNAAEVGWAVLMIPEPVDANHSQVEGRVTYAGDRLTLSGGYYGSFYRNEYGSLNPVVPGALFNAVGQLLPLSTGLQPLLNNPVALPPDNQAHHIDVTGTYGFSASTKLNFKLAYSQATQHQDFLGAGLTGAPAGVSDLGAKVSTTLAQVGFTSRPMPRLNLSGNVRYQRKDDDTPIAYYGLEGGFTYTNRQLPREDIQGKLQAGYDITSDWRGTVGVDYRSIDRGTFTPTAAVAGITALRQKTEEIGVRAELRRRMSENLSGALSVESSKRDGSNWLLDNSGRGVTEVTDAAAAGFAYNNGIFMPTLADRQRDKVKLSADWQPNDKLALQGVAEVGRDKFTSPSAYGLRKSAMNSLSLDATYALNDKWNLNGFMSYGRQELDQARPEAAFMAFDNKATTLGLGFTGKPMANLEIGGNLSFMDDRSEYAQTLDAGAGGEAAALLAATGGLPDTLFRQTTLKLFGRYTLDKQSSIRVDLAHQRTRWTDWAWGYNGVPFAFSDGTTIVRKPTQNVTFIGVTYVRRWP